MFDLDNILKKIKEVSTASEKWEQDLQDGFTKEVRKIFPQSDPVKGKDLRMDLSLCWKDADRGCRKEIRVPRLERTAAGELVSVNRMLTIAIPKGQGHQSILKLKEHGHACDRGGKAGDLFVVLIIPEDDEARKYNELNNDIFTNFQVASENIGRDLSKIFLLNTEIQQVVIGDSFGEDLRLDLAIEHQDAMSGCDREIKIPRLGRTETGKLDTVVKSLTVTVPAGAKHGSKLRLKEQGDACRNGGKAGDLYVYLLVSSPAKSSQDRAVNIDSESHSNESALRGEDLYVDLTIDFNDTVRGCERSIEVSRLELTATGEFQHVTKSLRFAIPADTSHGSRLRLKEQGNASRHGGKPGDLYLNLSVLPKDKSSTQTDRNIESKVKINGVPSRGEDIYIDLAIDFDDAILGCDRELHIPRIEMVEEDELEYIIKSLTVTIPVGTSNGNKLRLKEQGHACKYGGKSGDLYLYLLVPSQDKDRKRNGINIEAEIKITSTQASDGGELVVNTPTGWRTIFVSPGTQTGDSLVLRGCGVYQAGNPGKHGDYIIKFVCE
jgi:DnaJ-class molecular chaperone